MNHQHIPSAAEREAAIQWAEREYRNVDEFSRDHLEVAVKAWSAALAAQPVKVEPTERESFEQWAKRQVGDGPELKRNALGRYVYAHVQNAWVIWQAARAALAAIQPVVPQEPDWWPIRVRALIDHIAEFREMNMSNYTHDEAGDLNNWGIEAYSLAELCNTPTAPDAAVRDAARLDWLDRQGYGYGFEDMHESNRWTIEGPFASIRKAIDAALSASPADTKEPQ